MLKQYCVCKGEGAKPPTTFVSLSEVLILQQYVKWSGGRVEGEGAAVYNGNLRLCSHFLFITILPPRIGSIVAYIHSVTTGFLLSKINSHQSDTRLEQLTDSSLMKYKWLSLCILFLWMWLLFSSLSRNCISVACLMVILSHLHYNTNCF